jgi:hypothetical protein
MFDVPLNPVYEAPEVFAVETREGLRKPAVFLFESGIEEHDFVGTRKKHNANVQALVCDWVMHIPKNGKFIWLHVH